MRASFLGNLIIQNERFVRQKITVFRGATRKIASLTGYYSTRISNIAPVDCLPFNMTQNLKGRVIRLCFFLCSFRVLSHESYDSLSISYRET